MRRAAVVALASVGDAKSVPVLFRALGATTNAEAQQTIEMVLASLKGGPGVDEQIAALLDGKFSVLNPILIDAAGSPGQPRFR